MKMDKVALNLFMGANKLRDHEKIVYAESKDFYDEVLGDTEKFHKVITVNEETGLVIKYVASGIINPTEKWKSMMLH